MNDYQLLTFGIIAAAIGAAYAFWCAVWVLRRPVPHSSLNEPYLAIRLAAGAFLRTQYGVIFAIGVLLYFILLAAPAFGFRTALGFALGGICSGLSGALGLWVSVRANVRTTAAAEAGLGVAQWVALRAGSVTGFMVGGFALAVVSGFYLYLAKSAGSARVDLVPLAGLGFGASLVSIFARLGGGIFTKAADVGADLVGKIEQNIPEDDPRNPAVIADNVGDNVGDCAGMAADVFESYVVTLVATLLLARWAMPGSLIALQYPIALGGVGLLAGIVGMQTAHVGRSGTVTAALARGVVVSTVLTAGGFYLLSVWGWEETVAVGVERVWLTTLVGLVVAVALLVSTIYYTGLNYSPVHRIAHASCSGHGTNVITGLAVGMSSTLAPTLILIAGILVSFALLGIYGIAVTTCAMLALTPIIVSLDAYGPVVDNAGGIAEMAHMRQSIRSTIDALDAAGNTTKAVTKMFAIASAGLASLALFTAFNLEFGESTHVFDFAVQNPYTLAGLFIGSLLPFIFSGYCLDAVGKAATQVVNTVRSEFREHPEILEGKSKPDYARTVRMLTRSSLFTMLVPGLIPVVAPLLITFVWAPFGPEFSAVPMMGGMLIGSIICGYMLAVSMCTGGAAWDNAKKYIEAGHEGGKGSSAHHAAITGDTVGDPYKDTAGPAINPMCKVLNVTAFLLVPYLIP